MSTPVCSLVASVINLANFKTLAKKAIKTILKDTEDGILKKIFLLKVQINTTILNLKGELLGALPAGSLANIKGAISVISKVDDLQKAIKRGDAAGAAKIAGEIAEDFPMLADIDLSIANPCTDLPNLIKSGDSVLSLSSNLSMPDPLKEALNGLKNIADKAAKFAGDADSEVVDALAKQQKARDTVALLRREQYRRKRNVTIDQAGIDQALLNIEEIPVTTVPI